MDLWSTLRVLVKRWYLTLPLFALSVVITVSAVGTGPANYKSDASLLLLAPNVGGSNPYAQFGGSLSAAAEVLVASLNSSTSKEELEKEEGVKADWNVAMEGGDAPLLTVETTASTAQDTISSAQAIVASAKDRLHDLQTEAGSPASELITLSIVDTPDGADAEYGTKVKSGAAMLLVLLVLSCSFVLAVEGLLRRRGEARPREATSMGVGVNWGTTRGPNGTAAGGTGRSPSQPEPLES